MNKINLGCGVDYKKGYINVDNDRSNKLDVYADFTERLPFVNNFADVIYCKNVFEHIPNPLNFLLEIKRVLKNGGRAIIITSNASYFIYHFPRWKAYHDTYNYFHSSDDQHYFMFQPGHLIAFTEKADMKLINLCHYIANQSRGSDYYFQYWISKFIGKKFGYSDFYWEIEK